MTLGCFRCGPTRAALFRINRKGRPGVFACAEHKHLQPCIVPGCVRTGLFEKYGYEFICAEHWRRYVPPRSRDRRLFHAHKRRAKRLGWDDQRIISFWAFWDRLTARIIARATEGHVDMAEINKMFGWVDE